jgi:MFS family permease
MGRASGPWHAPADAEWLEENLMQSRTSDAVPVTAQPDSHPAFLAIGMFVVLLLTYALNAMDRQLFPLLVTNVRKDYGFSLADAGLLSTVFTLGMALAGVPTGYLMTRLSRKMVGIVGIVIFSAAMVLTAFCPGFWTMLICRAATGLGEAMQLTALLAIAAAYFARYRSAAVGSVNFCFGLGAIVGPLWGGALLVRYQSWKAPVIVFGLLGVVAIAMILVLVRSWLTESVAPALVRKGAQGASALANRNTLVLVLCSILGGLVIYGYLGMYPTFLREHLGYSPKATGSVMGIYGLGVLISIFGGWLGDRFSPRPVLGGAFLGAAALGYLLFHGSPAFSAQATLSFVWGLIVSGTIYVNLAGYHVKSVTGDLAGKASGLFVTSLYGSAAFAGYTLGWLATRTGWLAAGEIQISGAALIAAAAVLALRPDQMALSVAGAKKLQAADQGRAAGSGS